MNLMQKLIIARSAARSIPDADAYERAARRRRTLIKYVMLAMIVEGAIQCFKSYF